jgi:hypothetical protein
MSMPATTVDVTENQQKVADFLRSLGTIRQPITILLGGKAVARLVPPKNCPRPKRNGFCKKGGSWWSRRGLATRECQCGTPPRPSTMRSNGCVPSRGPDRIVGRSPVGSRLPFPRLSGSLWTGTTADLRNGLTAVLARLLPHSSLGPCF